MRTWKIPLSIAFSLLSIFALSSNCMAMLNDREPSEPSFIDRTHQDISQSLSGPAKWFDRFFRDPLFEEEQAGTFLRLRGSVITEEGENLSFTGKVKARLRLPNLKRRFHLILSSEEDDLRDETLRDARIERDLTTNEDTSLALQYTQERSTQFSLTHRLKLDLEDELNPQLRTRVRYSIPVAKEALLNLTQSFFWENEEGFGQESRIDYDVPLSSKMLVRLGAQGLFSESSNGYEWLGITEWLQSFSHKKALAIGGYVAGETRPQNHATEYDIFIKYRQQIVKKWFFVELKPEIKWPRENDFDSVGIFTLTFEVQFEG